jgi:hypothetical protein
MPNAIAEVYRGFKSDGIFIDVILEYSFKNQLLQIKLKPYATGCSDFDLPFEKQNCSRIFG